MPKKSRKNKAASQADDIPPHLRDFISSIALKELPDDPAALKRAAQEKRKNKMADEEGQGSNVRQMMTGSYQFTDLDIMTLWNSFRIEFPEGQITRPQLMEVVNTVFPKCDADVVINNIFKVFDPSASGKVVPQELLLAFSMSMKGSVEDKLHWTFRLYDVDGSGEIDPDEMEQIFTKLCQIASGTESDQVKKNRKKVDAIKAEERAAMEREQERELRRQREDLANGRVKSIPLLSQRWKSAKQEKDKNTKKKKPKVKTTNGTVQEADKDTKQKVSIMTLIAEELGDPSRDYKKFDPGKRARELFNALDVDGDGTLTEDEFVDGCLSDEAFVKVLTDFSGDFIWGYVQH